MNRNITVKGIGDVSVKPDLVVIDMKLATLHQEYEKAMRKASEGIEDVQHVIGKIGFEKTDLKTVSFNVSAKYESIKDSRGEYKSYFAGYECTHDLKLEFDLDTSRMSQVLTSLSKCQARPRLNIRFSVRDKNAVNENLLRSAAVNAGAKAEILCAATGVKLGLLQQIDYNWGELSLFSSTRCEDDTLMDRVYCSEVRVELDPEDIKVRDTVTFTWEIA